MIICDECKKRLRKKVCKETLLLEVEALRRVEAKVRMLPDGYKDPYIKELMAIDELRRRPNQSP